MTLMDHDGQAPQDDYTDFSNPINILRTPTWMRAKPEQRVGLVDKAMKNFLGDLETKRDKTVEWTDASGETKQVPVWSNAGTLTSQGEDYVSKVRSMFQAASQDEAGGLYNDEYTGKVEPAYWLEDVLKKPSEKAVDLLPDYQPWLEEKKKLTTENESPSLSWEEYVKFANADVQSEEAKIDVTNQRLKSEWAKRTAISTFSPDQMGEDSIGQIVGGQMVINPLHYSEIDKVEAWIAGQEKFSEAEKKLNLLEYRKKIEENAAPIISQFAAADAGIIGSVFSSPLHDEFQKAAENPNFSAYEFIKQNKERFSKDSYGVGEELATKFRDALMATGTGALFLAGKAADVVGLDTAGQVLSKPAEAWGGLAEDSSGAFSNETQFSIGGIDINRRDLTELAGQVGSFVAMGAMGALTGKGLLKASTSGAARATAAGAPMGAVARFAAYGSRYAPQGDGFILKSTLEAVRAAEAAGTKGFGSKLLGWLKDASTDPELYLGSLQAAGMSHGRTYNEVFERTGDRDQAIKEADIQGFSDGLSAFIATGVMNRVAPGMGKALGMGDGAVGGGFVQNIRNRTLSRDGMKVVQDNLEKLAGPGSAELRKQFAKDVTHAMTTSAKQLGLRGIGVAGNMGAEAVEEAADEIISDVLTSMMDDSKTWNETVWQNIGEKWQQYVKAGILGAIGGAMGDASGTAMNPVQTFGKSEGLKVQEAMWKQLKDRTAKFDSLDQYASTVEPNVTMAEYLASEVNSKGEKITIEEKSQALLAMARSGFHANFEAAVYAKEPDIAQGVTGLDIDEDGPDVSTTPSEAITAPATADQQDSDNPFAATMAKTGVKLATNHRWKESVSLSEDKRTHELGDGLKLRLLYANDGTTGATGLVGAKVVKTDGTEESLSPEQALVVVPNKMKHHKLRKALAGINPEAINAQFSEQAPDEQTEKQSTGSDGNSGQKPPASQAGSGNTGTPKGNGNKPATGNVPLVTPRQPEAPLFSEGVGAVPPRPMGDEELDIFDRAVWDGTYGEMAEGGRTHNDDGSPVNELSAVTDAAPPQTAQTDENQVKANAQAEGQGRQEGLLTEQESRAAMRVRNVGGIAVGAPAVTSTNKGPSHVFEKDAEGNETGVYVDRKGNVGVTEEAFKRILAENKGNAKPTMEAIQAKGEAVKAASEGFLDAKVIEEVPEVDSMLNQETSYVVSMQNIDNGNVDKAGGKWRRYRQGETEAEQEASEVLGQNETYIYTPPKNSGVSLEVGDVVLIAGENESVLILDSVSNGELVFRKVAIVSDSLRVMSAKQTQRSFQWNATKLLAGAFKARPLLTKLQSGTVTPSEIKGLFMEMVNLVAPGFKGQIVETKLDGESYLNADLGKGTINVDYAKLAANFRNLIQHANLTNDIANETIALDVARVMAKLIDEEVVHLLTKRAIDKKEAVSFYKQVWEKGQDSPFFDMLMQTARERYPNLSPDPYGDNTDERESVADDANAVYNISMELIRKLHQLSTTGATSESVTSDSFVMQAAIARDLKGEGNKVSKFVNMVRELVRRYTNRVRNILWMRWQQGRLPVEQQTLLARLNNEYRREQIQGDFDNAQQGAEQRAVMMATDADVSFKEWVNEKARANYEVLNELRALPERFANIQLEQMLIVDPETMTLVLNPPIRDLIEKYNLLDLAALDSALADLNTETTDGQEKLYDVSSYRQAMTVAFLKRQVMEAKLAALDFDMTAMLDEMDANVGKIQRSILDSAPVNRKAEVALRMLRMAEDETRRLERQIDFIKEVAVANEVAAYMAIDPTTIAGRVELINLIKKHPEYGMTLPRVTGEMSVGEVNDYFRALKDGFTHQAKLNAHRALHMVPVDGKPLADVDKVYGAQEYATLTELRGKLALNRLNVMALGAIAKEVAESVKSGELTPGDFREVAVADSRFQRFIEFRDAAEDYDQYLKNIVSRSLGDFFVNNKEFGVVFIDLSQREGSGAQMKFPEYKNTLPEAETAGEVFGADFKQKGERIAYLPERHYEKDGQPLTAQQIAENEERDLIDRMAKSNAAFAGRQHFNRAFLDYHLGNIGLDEDYDRYLETGGFKLNIQTDPDTGRVFVESPQAAFRTLNMTEIRAIRKGLKASSRTSGASLAELIQTVESVRDWARKINDAVGPGMTATIGGRQTLAARAKLMIDDQFGNKRNLRFVDKEGNVVMDELKGFSSKEINGLYPLINQLHESLLSAINPYVTITEKDGKLVITPKTTDGIKQATTAASDRLWAQDGKDAFTRMDSANETVKLVRTSLKEFKDRQWRQNYEREASRVQRQGMYDEGNLTPDNPELLELLESPIDTRLFSNGLWLTKFHEEPRDYSVSGNFAYEAMQEYAVANYGEGVLPDGERDPNSVAFDRRVNIGTMGEKSEDFIGLTGDLLPGSSLTAAESALNRAASGENSRRFWVTKWGLVIGATSDGLFNADEAKRFVFDMVNMERDGGSTLERMNLLKRGIRGLFPMASSFSEKNQNGFFNGALEQFLAANPGYVQGPDFSSETPALSVPVQRNSEEMSDFVAKMADNRFSAEQLLVDLLEFKAGFEREVLLEARVGDQLGAAINAVSMSLPSEETVDVEEEVDEITEEVNPEFEKFDNDPFADRRNSPPKTIKKTTKVKKIRKLKKSQLTKGVMASPEEALRIRDGLKLMVTENDVPLYDASLMTGGIDGIGNPFVSMLAQNLTGKTLVFSPTDKQVVKLGLQDVWMKIFPGRDGAPNLIYVPQGQASPEVSSQVVHGAIAQMLAIASQNPDVKVEIDRLGSTIAKALDPVMMVQSIQDELAKGKAKWLTPRISRKLAYSERRNSLRAGINEDNILNQFANEQNEAEADREIKIGAAVTSSDVYKALEPTLDDLSQSEKKQFRSDLAAHLLKMSELSRELGITNQTAASISLFPQRTAQLVSKDGSPETVEFSERKTTSHILLIAEVLTNPSAKKFLDESYKGPDTAENTRLSDAIEQALHSAIVSVRRTQGDEGIYNEDYIDGGAPNSNELSNREDDEIEDNEEPANANETTSDSPELEALKRAEAGDDAIEEQADEDAVENERYRREDRIMDAATDSVADMLLFNSLARILEMGKLANGFDYEGSPEQRRTYNVLAKPTFTDLSKKAKTQPLFSKNMSKASPSMIYAGEMRHLTLPKANGHTMHNLAFSARRTSNASAAVVLRAGEVRNIVNEVAQGYIQQTLRDNPRAVTFPRVDVRVPVTDNLISEISRLLPSGQFEQELASAREMLAGLDAKEENLLERRSKALEALYEITNEIGNVQSDRVDANDKGLTGDPWRKRSANDKKVVVPWVKRSTGARPRLEYEIKSLEAEIKSYRAKLNAAPSETGGRGEYQDDQHLDFLSGQLAATREALVQLDAVPEGLLEYADYESAELRRQVRDLAVAHVVNHAEMLEQGVIDAANMGETLATTLREAMANDSDLRGHANSLFDLLNQIRSNFVMHSKAALAEEGQSDIAPEGTSAVFARKIGLLMKAYNFHASILNSHIDYHARRGMALAGLNGENTNTRAFKVGKFDLGEESVVTPRLLGKMRSDLRGMLDAGPSAEAYFDLLVNNVTRSVTMESPKGANRNARKVNAFLRDIARDYIATPGMTETELRGLVEQKITKALDEQFASGLKTAMDEIALSVGEARALMDAKVMTPMQLERMKQVEIVLNHTREQLKQTRKELDRIDNNDGEQYLGLGYYQGEFGAPPVYDSANRVKTKPVPMGQRKFGVNLFLVAPGMEWQKQYGESDEEVQAKADTALSGWVNQTGTMDAATQAENNRRTQLRRDHWVMNRALTKALNDVVRDYIESSYAKARGTEENFVGFDPLKVINEAVDFSMAERAAMDRFFDQAAEEADMASHAGLSASAVALLTDPADGAYEALSATEKGKVRMLRMPENHRERKEKIGRLFEMDGEAVILMPTGAKERLMRAFPKTITKKNVNSELEGIVLDALPLNPQPNLQAALNPDYSYFLNGTTKEEPKAFDDFASFSLTNSGPLTKGEAAKLFRARFVDSAKKMMRLAANNGAMGLKEPKMDGDVTQASLNQFGYMLERLVIAHGDKKLSKETRKEVSDLLQQIDRGVIEQIGDGNFGVNESGIKAVRIHQTFAKVFSEIEAAAIQKRLIAGLSLTGRGREIELGMLKYLHHQDARIRHRFIKNHSARQAAHHLNAFLDYGIDGKSGRRGYTTSKKAAEEAIGKKAEEVGTDALNHTIGYLTAVFRGMDNAFGMNKVQAFKQLKNDMNLGLYQLREFDKAQTAYYRNSFTKYWNGHSLDLMRDKELAEKIIKVLNGIKMGNMTIEREADVDIVVKKIIAALEAEVTDGKLQEVRDYSDVITEKMTDIHNAMLFTTAMLSQDAADVEETQMLDWRDRSRPVFRETSTSVPLRLSYASNPDPEFLGKESEGRYISDPADLVSFKDASFFGGHGRNEVIGKDQPVFRPIAINGLTSPLSMMDDALYRLNITPTYEALRRAYGRATTDHGIPTVKDGHFLEKVAGMAPDEKAFGGRTRQYREALAEHDDNYFEFQKALAGVASELEVVLQNDSQINVMNTGGAEVMRFLGSAYIFRALASPLQLWDQTASPSIGYTAGKLVTGRPRMAANYFKIIGRILTDGKFRRQVKDFIKRVEPMVFYRSADGQDVARDVMGSQVRYGRAKVKNTIGKGLRKYENYGEKALMLTIGSGERVIAASVFITELMEQMGDSSLERLLELDADAIPMTVKNDARIKVNDLMSQSDQAKKSWMFQTRTSSPARNALFRSLVRFSNHTAGVASNVSAMSGAAVSPLMSKIDGKKFGGYDKESQQEALDVVVTTLTQNILFYPMKLKIMVPLLAHLAFMLGGDDDDEAVRKGQELANTMLAPTDDGTWFGNFVKGLVFGKKRELFQLDPKKTADAAQSSALAEVMTKTFLETFQLIPVAGAAAGYAPVSGVLQKVMTNPLSESATSILTGVEKATGPYSKKATTIRSYEKNWDENLVSATAPTQMVYDLASALKLSVNYNLTREAATNRPSALINTAAYLVAEGLPFGREPRSAMRGVLQEPVWKEEKRKR
jgi:hypothetical protein